jgi:diacylglycerol kinase family enzyme
MKIAAVLNRSAGSLIDRPHDATARAVAEALASGGAEVSVVSAAPADCPLAIRRALDSDADVLVIGGGDGTIATAANLILPTGKALGILPVGTMNLLARDLRLPLELEAAARALGQGRLGSIDVAEINGEVFLNNSVLGIYPAMVAERERRRGDQSLSRIPAMAIGMLRALWRFPILKVTLETDDGARRIQTPFLAVSNNPYDAGYGPVLRRSRLDGGTLGVYVGHHRSAWGMLRLMVRMGLGTWAKDGDLDQFAVRSITVHSGRRRLSMANDGEIRRIRTPLVYRIRPEALRVLLPKESTSG